MLIESTPHSAALWPFAAPEALLGAPGHQYFAPDLQATLWQVLSETLVRLRSHPGMRSALVAEPPASQAGAARQPGAPGASAAPQAPVRLSAREHEVLQRIAAGESNKVIARSLELSPHTVKRHVANLLDKLGASSRGQAAAWWQAQHARPRG
ncbi:MAG: helix-turn-helix transcriptional regulator [Burkholderiaceae bacterium]